MESTFSSRTIPGSSGKTKDLIISAICLLCVFLFVYVGYSKLIDHQRFLAGLSKVEMLKGLSFFLSWFIPVSELIVALLLILPHTRNWGFIGFIGLMVLF
ncbi:MAG TPA: MauE/DoxX family redox-associated membrane protein, partial [Hanamia sp.]|nr:MauE/DoxX family redox-associated membrane protein [Hanamia sp.]